MHSHFPIHIEKGAISSLIHYCESHGLDQFALVADQNTYPVLGKVVEDALTARRFDVNTIVLSGEEIIADERYIMQVLVQADTKDRVYLAVGSGTITDIVRFVSHRTKTSFISVPTAPSVDGFTSSGAPLVLERLKQTIYTQPPSAVFADLDVLCTAPRPMIASGFGDILGKYTSLADWKLGHLLWDEAYSEPIARRVQKALQDCVDYAEKIGRSSPEGIRRLMDGLIESGLCMLDFGSSPPASGAEHYISHYWEMKLLEENRPAILHGAKVGVACVLVATYYEKIRQLAREDVVEMLSRAVLPDRGREIQRIRTAYGAIADKVIKEQTPFLDMSEESYGLLKQKIVDHWADVQEITAIVPTPQELVDLLRQVGGPVDAKGLGLADEEVRMGLHVTHYFRNRFSVMKLCYILGILE